jgi:hypothetical protein
MASNERRIADYKGRTYRVLFLGNTKFGRRANLEFTDGSKSFWVDASMVSNVRPFVAPKPAAPAVDDYKQLKEFDEFHLAAEQEKAVAADRIASERRPTIREAIKERKVARGATPRAVEQVNADYAAAMALLARYQG